MSQALPIDPRSAPNDDSMTTRLLRLAGTDANEAKRLEWLRLFLIAHIGFELVWSVPWGALEALWTPAVMVDSTALAGLYVALGIGLCLVFYRAYPDRRLLISRVAALLGVLMVALWFGQTANHYFLAVSCLVMISIVDLREEREALLALQTLRILVASMFFFSGLQKVLYGTYFRGEFLAWAIANTDRFAFLFQHLLPDQEFHRLQNLPPFGPFGTDWLPLILLSNSVWITELLLPFFWFHRKTRGPATFAAVLFLVAIEAGAREWFFASVFICLMMLMPKKNYLSILVPSILVIYCLLLIFSGTVHLLDFAGLSGL